MGRWYALALAGVIATTILSAQGTVTPLPRPNAFTPTVLNARAVSSALTDDPTLVITPMLSRGAPTVPKALVSERIQETAPGLVLGGTWYDFQTNATMLERLTYYKEGSDKIMQVVWMASQDSTRDPATRIPGFNTARGTHYQYLDVSNPDAPEAGINGWGKVAAETGVRTGWAGSAQFEDGSLIYAAHSPVRVFRNGGVGDDNFVELPVDASANTSWPRIAIDGAQNVHIIYNDQVNSVDQVAYRRSRDGGETWSDKVYLTGSSSTGWGGTAPQGGGGDAYTIKTRGNKVVIMFEASNLVVYGRSSEDGGDSWTDVYGIFGWDGTAIDSSTYSGGDSITVYYDTVSTPGRGFDCMIDSDGTPHYVAGEALTYLVQKGLASDPTTRRGTIYSVDSDEYYANTGFLYYKQGDTLLYRYGIAGQHWDGQGTIVSRRPYTGSVRYPQLGLDASNNLYMVYSSVVTGDAKTMQIDSTPRYTALEPDTLSDVDGLYGHIFATYKPSNTNAWSTPVSITPNGVNCLFPTLCDNVQDGRMFLAYSSNTTPGDHVTNVELASEYTNIHFYAFPTNQLGSVNSVSDEPLRASVVVSPNPVRDVASVRITAQQEGAMTLRVVSPLGETMVQSTSPAAGSEWTVSVPTQQMPVGAYYVVVEQAGRRLTVPMSVVR
jgi:hypothetical protein